MKINRKIKMAICYGAAIVVCLATLFGSTAFIGHVLGDGMLYSVKTSASWVLSIIAAIYTGVILYPAAAEEEYDFAEPEEEKTEEPAVSTVWEKGEIDEAEYPELFSREEKTEDENAETSFPDIKKIICEQKAESDVVQKAVDTKSAWDEFVGIKEDSAVQTDFYADIPTELPEDYVPNYVTEEEPAEEEEEEAGDAPESKIKNLLIKASVALVLCALAVLLPSRLMTVYTEDSIIKYGLTGETEYKYTDAHHYTVGVKMSGDISVKVSFGDKTFELVTDGEIMSDGFDSKFSSPHSYAAHCDRIMKNAGVDKNISNLSSLNRVPEDQIRYANEITENYIENNKK